MTYLKNQGYCPTCESEVTFESEQEWLRDHYFCSNCGSIPRERALMQVLKTYYPNWAKARVHESSPGHRGVSVRLKNECKKYVPSQYFYNAELGTLVDGARCENLESLTFENESIDIHITQDVIEHVFNPQKVFAEIARTLVPGGMHIFTVPIVNKYQSTERRAKLEENGKITHLKEASYHGNPIGDGKSLVTMDWGFDICNYIFESSGLFTQIIYIDDVSKGIRAEFIEVLITSKPYKKNNHDSLI